jgi:hypothetical protein
MFLRNFFIEKTFSDLFRKRFHALGNVDIIKVIEGREDADKGDEDGKNEVRNIDVEVSQLVNNNEAKRTDKCAHEPDPENTR